MHLSACGARRSVDSPMHRRLCIRVRLYVQPEPPALSNLDLVIELWKSLGACLNSHCSILSESDSSLAMSKYFRPGISIRRCFCRRMCRTLCRKAMSRGLSLSWCGEPRSQGDHGSYVSGLGQPPFDPRMMVALLLHGYASGLYSSRRIAERAASGTIL